MQLQSLPADPQPFILVIDSPHAPAPDMQPALEQAGYQPLGPVDSLAEGLALATGSRVPVAALVVLDGSLPGETCPEPGESTAPGGLAAERLRIGKALQNVAGLPVLYLAEEVPESLVTRLASSAARGFVSRPVRPRALRVMVEMARGSRRSANQPGAEEKPWPTPPDERDALQFNLHESIRSNLQIITSLQEDFFDDLSTRRALHDLHQRLQVIALVHTPRYQAGYSATLDLSAYLSDLTESIPSSLAGSNGPGTAGAATDRVSVQTDLDRLLAPAGIVVACGLILYELLSNALQHAFPGWRSGSVLVWLHQTGQVMSLGVADDGVGFPNDFDYRRDSHLGLQIVQALVEYQLHGTLACYNQPGLRWEIRFTPGQ